VKKPVAIEDTFIIFQAFFSHQSSPHPQVNPSHNIISYSVYEAPRYLPGIPAGATAFLSRLPFMPDYLLSWTRTLTPAAR
jgi:hypothetical protein